MKDLWEEILELTLPDEPLSEPKRAKIFEKKSMCLIHLNNICDDCL